jgi:hypothetical protein
VHWLDALTPPLHPLFLGSGDRIMTSGAFFM